MHLTGTAGGPLPNQMFCCLVISPPGRAICESKSILRDAIKGHRSPYQDGDIPHRDVSENNIIAADAENEKDQGGMLIDLGTATVLDNGSSKAGSRIGTVQFMVIQALEGKPHTYRHDLESFLRVFVGDNLLRQGPRRGLADGKPASRLVCRRGIRKDGKAEESGYGQDGIQEGHRRAPSAIRGITKPPAEEPRDILFPCLDGLFAGTDTDPTAINSLYDDMAIAFEKAIKTYKQSPP
jgi:serine/threonine protein kinase